MTNQERARLRELAMKARGAVYSVAIDDPHDYLRIFVEPREFVNPVDVAHLFCACSPETILSLLDALDTVASEARAEALEAAARILDAALLPNIAAAIRAQIASHASPPPSGETT